MADLFDPPDGLEAPRIRYKPKVRQEDEDTIQNAIREPLRPPAEEAVPEGEDTSFRRPPILEPPDIGYHPTYTPYELPREREEPPVDPDEEGLPSPPQKAWDPDRREYTDIVEGLPEISTETFEEWKEDLRTYTAGEALDRLRQNANAIDEMCKDIEEALEGDKLFEDMLDAGRDKDFGEVDNIVDKVNQNPEESPLIPLYAFLRHLRGKIEMYAAIAIQYLFSPDLYKVENIFPKSVAWLNDLDHELEMTSEYWTSGQGFEDLKQKEQERVQRFIEAFPGLDVCAKRLNLVILRIGMMKILQSLSGKTEQFLKNIASELYVSKALIGLIWFIRNREEIDESIEAWMQEQRESVEGAVSEQVNRYAGKLFDSPITVGDRFSFTLRDIYHVFDNTNVCSEETFEALILEAMEEEARKREEAEKLVADMDPNLLMEGLDHQMEASGDISDSAIADDVLHGPELTPEQEIIYGWMLERTEKKQDDLQEWMLDAMRYEHAYGNGLARYDESYSNWMSSRNVSNFNREKTSGLSFDENAEKTGFIKSFIGGGRR